MKKKKQEIAEIKRQIENETISYLKVGDCYKSKYNRSIFKILDVKQKDWLFEKEAIVLSFIKKKEDWFYIGYDYISDKHLDRFEQITSDDFNRLFNERKQFIEKSIKQFTEEKGNFYVKKTYTNNGEKKEIVWFPLQIQNNNDGIPIHIIAHKYKVDILFDFHSYNFIKIEKFTKMKDKDFEYFMQECYQIADHLKNIIKEEIIEQ